MSGATRKRGRGRAAATGGGDGESSQQSSSQRGARRGPLGGFDGPASRGSGTTGTSGARPPSIGSGGSPQPREGGQAGSRHSSVSGAQSQTTSQVQQQATPRGDPALDRPQRITDALKNVDLPASFFNIDNLYSIATEFKQRPSYNNSGKAIQLSVNAYPVLQYPNVNVYQYDVVIGNGAEKRVIQQKVWQSQVRKDATGDGMIYDGNKLAWSMSQLREIRVMVDLDVAEGRPSRGDRNTFRLRIAPAKKMDIGVLQSFLDGRIERNVPVLEAVNFLDHLLREGPTLNPAFVALRRSFFARNADRADLGGAVEVFRGVYQSLRLAEGKKMIINVDVANTTFWKPSGLLTALVTNQKLRDPQQLIGNMQPDRSNGSKSLNSTAKTIQTRFKGTLVTAQFQGNPTQGKEWKIHSISTNNADEERIEWKDPNTKKPTGEKLTITQYFKRKYNINLQFPKLLLMEMTKKGVKYPMELLHIKQNQRYGAKLDEAQTANMIKFAVSPPAARLKAINTGKDMLAWDKDKYLQNYGLKIGQEAIKSNARLLPAPGVKFGNRTEQPGTKGRWDLRGKMFLSGNPQELKSWGVGVFTHGRFKPDKPAIEKFALDFTRAYRNHGGKVANGLPYIAILPPDAGVAVEKLHQETGNNFRMRPQLLIFLVPDRASFFYQRIKKSADCRYGVVSQVMQLQQVLKGNPQYYSNVLMKVNAKLGGCTSQAIPHALSGNKGFPAPTLFIGADVSHASPGSMAPSMAALTVSFDRHAGRYAAACQTNGIRVEMISEANMRSMLGPLITQWVNQVGGGQLPSQVYYMRDGVSEGQFAHVLQQEVPHIRAILSKISGKPWEGKLTVVVASKRHHVRAFPTQGSDAGDQKGNPVPGCLIERDVTTPTEWDFYLYSHIALQGTSRPVHYTILYDNANHKPERIQNMIYEHCYQYMRSTTSVSLHPAVYYAHLASNRAISHMDIESSQGPTGGPGFKQGTRSSDSPPDSETKPLLKMYNVNNIEFAMWYI